MNTEMVNARLVIQQNIEKDKDNQKKYIHSYKDREIERDRKKN